MYVYTHKFTHKKPARYVKLKCIPKVKPPLLLTDSTVNSTEFSREISVILTKCIFILVAYFASEESFCFTDMFAMSVLCHTAVVSHMRKHS